MYLLLGPGIAKAPEDCLPCGWLPWSVGSKTPTTISVGLPVFICDVMSKAKLSYPPEWLPTSAPLT